jgi:glycosyltransferase involved in cell wall biosynthesis
MRLCMIGKYPPIEGGVSMRMYHVAHALARSGHEVHVVTNAAEVRPPFRIFMRDDDWARCETNVGPGRVRVHWTDPACKAQSHIPWHNPFVTKLASLAATVASENQVELIYSYYLEPYGVAGHLAAEMVRLPHVVKLAGSDAGRLRHLLQFGPLYDHILRSANRIMTGGEVSEQLLARGVEKRRLHPGLDIILPEDTFSPEGPPLDLVELAADVAELSAIPPILPASGAIERPSIGVYGKLGDSKGTFDLLTAVADVARSGRKINLLVMGHAVPAIEARFHDAVSSLGLEDFVLQLPFLPHWRMPEFIRRCLAVCCLEQNFPIPFHAPIIPREVLLCGGCLVGTTEVLRKLPSAGRLVHGYNCVAVEDSRDTRTLSAKIAAILDDPERAPDVGRRGREFALAIQDDIKFPENYERLFNDVIDDPKKKHHRRRINKQHRPSDNFILTRLATASLTSDQRKRCLASEMSEQTDLEWSRAICTRLQVSVEAGESELALHLDAVRLDVQIAETFRRKTSVPCDSEFPSQLCRLRSQHWAIRDEEILDLRPKRVQMPRIEEYSHDVNVLLAARNGRLFPGSAPRKAMLVATWEGEREGDIRIIVLGQEAAQLLMHCAGTCTIREIAEQFQESDPGTYAPREVYSMIIQLFELGLIGLLEREA